MSQSNPTTIKITYDVPIANPEPEGEEFGGVTLFTADNDDELATELTSLGDELGIRVEDTGGCFVANTAAATKDSNGVRASFDDDVLSLMILATSVKACDDGGVITIHNVLLTLAGSGIDSGSVDAMVSTTSLDYIIADPSTTIIRAVVDALDADDGVTVARADIQEILPRTGTTDSAGKEVAAFTFTIEENAVDSFGDGMDPHGPFVHLNFEGLPDGIEVMDLKATVWRKDDKPKMPLPAGTDATALTVEQDPVDMNEWELHMYEKMAVDDDTSADVDESKAARILSASDVDTILVTGMIGFPDKATEADVEEALPLAAGNITVEATLGPLGSRPAELVPRFEADWTDADTIMRIGVVAEGTTLTIPFLSTMGNFDTAIAISNLSTGEDEQPATKLTFTIWQNGEDVEYVTDRDSPGLGLSGGNLMAGETYTVLISEILTEARVGGEFNGFITIESDVKIAGVAYITDFDGFAAAATVLNNPMN